MNDIRNFSLTQRRNLIVINSNSQYITWNNIGSKGVCGIFYVLLERFIHICWCVVWRWARSTSRALRGTECWKPDGVGTQEVQHDADGSAVKQQIKLIPGAANATGRGRRCRWIR